MLEFDFLPAFYLLPLPWLVYTFLPANKKQQAAIHVPFFHSLEALSNNSLSRQGKMNKVNLCSLVLIWLLLLTAAASPKWIGDDITLESSGRDLLLAVDLSKSMAREDMIIKGEPSNRLIAVKAVIADFLERRKGDRVGLILFADQAYVQAPLTFDKNTVKQFLLESEIGFAGSNTAIGDAIGLSIKRLKNRPANRHVLILVTDGANTAGAVKPLPAAKLAAENNITIYTIGVGAEEMIRQGLLGFGNRRINPSADLDEQTLQSIANITGGQYFRARNPEELLDIYKLLDELEPIEGKAQTFRPVKKLFFWPLAIALVISFLLAIKHCLPSLLSAADIFQATRGERDL